MKYKLIKEYPGSPKLGTELTPKVDKENTSTNNYYWEGSWFNPKDFSELWELVVEKDYEILSLINIQIPSKPVIITKKENNLFSIIDTPGFKTLEFYDKYDYIKIHSVKRLSDGEIFTIGDEIYSTNWNCGNIDKKSDILTEISLNNEFMFKTKITWQCNLKDIQHYKQPLFTTEDSVDIFEGDNYWCAHNENFGVISMRWSVNNNSYVATNNIIYDYNTTKGKQKQHQCGNFYFSTKEKAEEYIIMNKPCLSINEIQNLFKRGTKEDEMIKLVKSKIKQSV